MAPINTYFHYRHIQNELLASKASWRKFHAAVNQNHYFEACTVTDRFCHDDSQVKPLLKQANEPIDQFTDDGAYDETPVYEAVLAHSPDADVVIPPRTNAVVNEKAEKALKDDFQLENFLAAIPKAFKSCMQSSAGLIHSDMRC
ncbi:MAG: transposase [Legionella steelei]|uniref:Transposase n=1 Tax=Legionella steelei TaxID=947033 RepID=A0A0W0ZFR4_9GAMM|nr:transposase [Legionella steelei]MBN9227898.1 transposase [Legionella steelei]OJW10206.1 MAG: hypothetical protein BGO44_00020 [Legionella sp. 39-23]